MSKYNINEWRNYLKRQQLSEQTIYQYTLMYKRFCGRYKLIQEHINKFFDESIYPAKKSFIQLYIKFRGKRTADYDIPKARGRKNRPIPDVLTQSEIEYILDGETKSIKLLVYLMYDCGLRVSEVCDLIVHNIDLDKNTLKIKRKGGKMQILSISNRLLGLLEQHIMGKLPNEKIFQNIYRVKAYRICTKLGDKIGKKGNPHVFRHSFAMRLRRANVPLEIIQRMLGHSNIQTTQVYARVEDKEVERYFKEIINNG